MADIVARGLQSHRDFIDDAFNNGAGGRDRQDPWWDPQYDPTPFLKRRAGLLCKDFTDFRSTNCKLAFWDPNAVKHWNFRHPQVGALKRIYPGGRETKSWVATSRALTGQLRHKDLYPIVPKIARAYPATPAVCSSLTTSWPSRRNSSRATGLQQGRMATAPSCRRLQTKTTTPRAD